MTIKGHIIEIFDPIQNTKIPKQEFGVEFESAGRLKQAKFTLKGDMVKNADLQIDQEIELEFELDPWRNRNVNNPQKPFYNHELRVIKIY